MRIDDEMLMAFLDGELEGAERDAVERALQDDPDLRAKLDMQQRLRSTLKDHYDPAATEEVPERLLALLGATAERDDEKVVSLSAVRERKRSPVWRNFGAIAATLAIGLIAGHLIPQRASGPFATQNGVLVAQGGLADALETQLASAQGADTATRIGVTFPDREGRLCRTFDSSSVSGLACHEDGNWSVIMTAAGQGTGATEYRQAGSSLILQAAQEMMAGAPLDAEAERAAMRQNWRISPSAGD